MRSILWGWDVGEIHETDLPSPSSFSMSMRLITTPPENIYLILSNLCFSLQYMVDT